MVVPLATGVFCTFRNFPRQRPKPSYVDKCRSVRDDRGYQAKRSPRTEPAMTSLQTDPTICQWFPLLALALDSRSCPRLSLLFLGAVLARGRRTVTSWIRAAGLSKQFRSCHIAVAAAGKKADKI